MICTIQGDSHRESVDLESIRKHAIYIRAIILGDNNSRNQAQIIESTWIYAFFGYDIEE